MTSFHNLIEALESAPTEAPFVTEWVDEDEQKSVTFGDFRQQAAGQASILAANGVVAGDRVIIIMPQGIASMAAFVGAMLLGAVPAFLAYPNFKVEAAKYRSGLAGVTANLRAKAVVIDDAFPEDMLPYVSLSSGTRLLRAGSDEATPIRVSGIHIQPGDLAFIQHSAGTTGLQKGVALTHLAVLRQIEALCKALKIEASSDRIYSWLPLYHDMGLIACFMLPMVSHVPVVMQSPVEWVMRPETMLRIIQQHQCTLAWMPNFAFQFVPRRTPESRRASYDLSSLRAFINCSEPVRAASMAEFQRAFGVKREVLQSSYAMAENVFAVTQSDIHSGPALISADGSQFRSAHRIVEVGGDTPGAIALLSSGRLLAGNEMRICDESGMQLENGRIGEILIKSDYLFNGYYNRPDLTSEAVQNGWYRTGDLGFLWRDEAYVVGRKKDLLIVGGENIYPQDLEEAAAAHPAVHDGRVIALGVYNAQTGTEDIVVVAEIQSDDLLGCAARTEQEVREYIVAATGVAVRTVLLKPPKWIVKSTAGKPARAATRDKLLHEHPEFTTDAEVHRDDG